MGPEAASELEPAGAWEGFCLPGATGCWGGSAAASSALGAAAGGGRAGNGLDGIPRAGCAVPTGGSLSPSPVSVGEHFMGIARRVVLRQLCTSARRKLGQLHLWVLPQLIGVELACLSAGKAG